MFVQSTSPNTQASHIWHGLWFAFQYMRDSKTRNSFCTKFNEARASGKCRKLSHISCDTPRRNYLNETAALCGAWNRLHASRSGVLKIPAIYYQLEFRIFHEETAVLLSSHILHAQGRSFMRWLSKVFFPFFVCVTNGPLSMTSWSLFRLAGTFDFSKRFAVVELVTLQGSFLVCLLLPHLIHLSRRWRLHSYTEGGGVGEEEVSARSQGHLCFLSHFGTTLCAAR